ncbi:MAG: hypothetical protein E7333_02020 [Clostridiales bacterium]|nr:hypothetical protein [Clostridiales bacterium]
MVWLVVALMASAAFLCVMLWRHRGIFSGRAHLQCPSGLMALMRRALSVKGEHIALDALHLHAQQMVLCVTLARKRMARLPSLPCQRGGEIRLLHRLSPLPEDMTAQLTAMMPKDATWREREQFLPALTVLLSRQLMDIIGEILLQVKDARRGRRMAASRRKLAALSPEKASPALLCSLYAARKTKGQDILPLETAFRLKEGEAVQIYRQQQSRLAGAIQQIAQQLAFLQGQDALALALTDCPLDALLNQDETYPRMTAASKGLYLRKASHLAQLFRKEEAAVVRCALQLSKEQPTGDPRRHVGYYLLEQEGQSALRRALKSRRGGLALFAAHHRQMISLLLRWGLSLAALMVFLLTGHSLYLAPFALIAAGDGFHLLLKQLHQDDPMPEMALSPEDPALRTLVVLPQVLCDHHDAIRAARQLLMAQTALAPYPLDCLLLADFAPAMTAHAAGDEDVMLAAKTALSALQDACDGVRFWYVQRSRAFHPDTRLYEAPDDATGAMLDAARLICHGETSHPLTAGSEVAGALHRRYTWIYALTPDALLSPGSFPAAAGVLAHPLSARTKTPHGWHGVTMAGPVCRPHLLAAESLMRRLAQRRDNFGGFSGVGLIRPEGLLEGTEGYFTAGKAPSPLLAGMMCGSCVAGEACYLPLPDSAEEALQSQQQSAARVWRLAKWTLPWVHTPRGIHSNPLPLLKRFSLRQVLRTGVLPLCLWALVLGACWHASLPLLIFVLLLPLIHRPSPLRFAWETVCLPSRALFSLMGLLGGLMPRLFRRPLSDENIRICSLWAQIVTAAGAAALSFARGEMFFPGAAAAILFTLSPVVISLLHRPADPAADPDDADESLLTETATAAWNALQHHTNAGTPLSAWTTSGEAVDVACDVKTMALYGLACVSALEMGLASADEAGLLLQQWLEALEHQPRHMGLPLESPISGEPYADSRNCGLCYLALRIAAQALRGHLAACDASLRPLPARLDAFAAAMELSALYDAPSGTFFERISPKEAPSGHIFLLADQGLCLSFAALMQDNIPTNHLHHLLALSIRAGRHRPLMSLHGSPESLLVPSLVLPLLRCTLPGDALQHHLHLHKRRKHGALWGRGECFSSELTAGFVHRMVQSGDAFCALIPPEDAAVFAPHISAMALSLDGTDAAAECLQQFRSMGLITRSGVGDAIDFAPEGSAAPYALVPVESSAHQAMILCGVCNALTGGALRHCLLAIPRAETVSLLLMQLHADCTLPLPMAKLRPSPQREPSFRRIARSNIVPMDAHILGGKQASMIIHAGGSNALRMHSQPLTAFSGDPARIEGVQFYLVSGGHTFRLTDPTLPGETVFSEGTAVFNRRMGSLASTLTTFTDPVTRSLVFMAEITAGDEDAIIEIASCLLPDVSSEVTSPREGVLHLHGPCPCFCRFQASLSPAAFAHQTDAHLFLGSGSLASPASLKDDLTQGVSGATQEVCLAFRARFHLPARQRLTITWHISPEDANVAASPARSVMGARALCDHLGINQAQAQAMYHLCGSVFWRHQPHQGADQPLTAPMSALEEKGIPAHLPLICLAISSPEGFPLMEDAQRMAELWALSGFDAHLAVLCHGLQPLTLAARAQEHLFSSRCTILGDLSEEEAATLLAVSRLLLSEGHGNLIHQLGALETPLPVSLCPEAAPGKITPPEHLLFGQGVGGFEEGTGHYLTHLTPGYQPPVPWRNLLAHDRFRTLADTNGLGPSAAREVVSAGESAYIFDGTGVFSATPAPAGAHLSWDVRHGPQVSTWHTATSRLDATFTAAPLLRHPCGLRTLHLKNLSPDPVTVTLLITADFTTSTPDVHLTPFPHAVIAHTPEETHLRFVALAEGEGETFTTLPVLLARHSGQPDIRDEHLACRGSVAAIRLTRELLPGRSETVSWLMGSAMVADDVEWLLRSIRQTGVSAQLRMLKRQWVRRISGFTLPTEDEALALLATWLPVQYLHSDHPLSLPARTLTDGKGALSLLLLTARDHLADPLLGWLCGVYAHITGDTDCWQAEVPAGAFLPDAPRQTLLDACISALSTPESDAVPLLQQHLSKRMLRTVMPGVNLPDLPDAPTPENECLPRALYALIDPADPKRREGLLRTLNALTDETFGLLRASPGQPQSTLDAAWMLLALRQCGLDDAADRLLAMLNPIHHTDDPLRLSEYRREPYLLSATVFADAPHHGQAGSVLSPEAAALICLAESGVKVDVGNVAEEEAAAATPVSSGK